MFPSVSQLDSFTDVLGDDVVDENLSQPLSLPSTCDTLPSSNGLGTNCEKKIRPLKHTGQHGEFRSVEEIDPKYRCLFTYPYFNLVQSRIIEDALYSDKSLVVCAPTGSGKTVVFELAILQLLMQVEDQGSTQDFKIIYMAPVKAVCSERLAEWYPKLTRLGLLCVEVTGDTEVDFSQLEPYRVIITTPEKWDMLTRRWRDHRGLVEMIKLFLIDEVHILNDESRGPVLEAVVSRMKTVESAAQSAHRIEQLQQQYQGGEATHSSPPRIRFVAVSATVSNPEDVAEWLGTSEKPAVFHKFGDECRPVKLQRIVEGYPCAEGTSIFKFDLILNYKLWPIIQKYHDGKPTLIFCNTRKSVTLTAEALSREVTVNFSPEQKAKLTALASTLKNKKLQTLVLSGVGCHHAGLLYEERVNIERAFRNMDLPILITTTTLAMGVNLPAHLVIVKNTQQYVNGAYQEYSISTVLQMVGRAGRPQFDASATAVIMTRLKDKPRYQALVGGCEPLQSYLHKRLAENLNSEAALGTVTDVAQCVEWLRSTFLYVRAAKDPRRYLGLPPAAPTQLILKKIEELCVKAMNSLASSGLITMDEASCIEATEAGRLMSLFYMDVGTMKNIMKIEGTETLEKLLWLVCESHELADMHLRVDERRTLNLLNRNNNAATIRFPMKGKISTRQMKLNCIIQATLGCLSIPEPALNQEAMKVMRTASRVCKCLVKYVTRPELISQQPRYFSAVLNSIVLAKCMEAHLWENSPYVSRQLKGIGPTFSTLLASAGVTSFMLLEESHPRDLERIMNKGPPAGNVIRKQVSLLPKYQLTVTPIDSRSITVQLLLLNHAHLSENMHQLTAGDGHRSYLVVGDSDNNLILLTQFTDRDFISVYDGKMEYVIRRKLSTEHKVFVHCVSSVIAGIDAQADYLFLDLEPQTPRDNYWSNSNNSRINVAGKQTAITDVYRERKRKPNCDNDITQCKEKKKRENNLTQKLQALKESFGKTSKAIKTDIDKSVAQSNKVIHDILDGKSTPVFPAKKEVSNGKAFESSPIDLTKDVVVDPLEEILKNDDDDYIDDLQIDSILSKIESEISGNDPVSNNMPNNKANDTIPAMSHADNTKRTIQGTEKYNLKYRNIKDTPYFVNEYRRSAKDLKKNKIVNMKTNYSFIDSIEKKEKTDDIERKRIDSGFSDAIKSQINKFLQRAQTTTKQIIPELDELIETTEHDELPEVYVKPALTYETNKLDNPYVACSEVESPHIRDNVNTEQDCLKDEKYAHGIKLDTAEVNINIESTGTKQCAESQKDTINMTSDTIDLDTIQQESKIFDANYDFGQVLDITQNTLLNTNIDNLIDQYNDKSEKTEPCSEITRDKNLPANSEQYMAKPSEKNSTALMPYNNNVEAKDIEDSCDRDLMPFNNQKVEAKYIENSNDRYLVPYNHKVEVKYIENNSHRDVCKSLTPSNTDLQHAFSQNMILDKLRTAYQDSHQMHSNSPNCVTVNQMGPMNFKPVKYNHNSIQDSIRSSRFYNAHLGPIVKRIYNLRDTKNLAKEDEENGHIKNKYSASNNNWVTLHQKVVQSGVTNSKQNNHNLIQNDIQLGNSYNAYPGQIVKRIEHLSDTKNMSKKDQGNYHTEKDQTNCIISHRKEGIQTSVSNLKALPNNDSSIENHSSPSTFTYTDPSVINKIENQINTKHNIEQHSPKYYKNKGETYFKSFSYTATKVDVCTKKYAPDHELRITRKMKVDVDITAVVKQDKANKNKSYEGDHMVNKSEQNKATTNLHEITTPENTSESKDIKEITGSNHIHKVDPRDKLLDSYEHKQGQTTVNNSIENILQKYSKILAKPETQTTSVNKITKRTETNTIVDPKTTDSSTNKIRKPFRITDINNLDVTLPEKLTNTQTSASISTPIASTFPTVKVIKAENISRNPESYESKNINSTPETCDHNDKSYESPDSVRSLELDQTEDVKDDSMFNPKLLLQYFTEDDQNVTDIIAPPEPFSDKPSVYSPAIADHETTEFYNTRAYPDALAEPTSESFGNPVFDLEYSNDIDYLDNSSSNLQLSPNEMETWCLSRDENTYASPIPSVPWSQRAHNSRVTGLGSGRAKLCQFKFVRKKSFRP